MPGETSSTGSRWPTSRVRGALWVFLVAVAAFANSVGNGFAYDDNHIILRNPTVTQFDLEDALGGPYWPPAMPGAGLYRPVTVTSFAFEWKVFGARPGLFHAVNVLVHAGVAVLLYVLVGSVFSPRGAVLGATLFAVHPVHTEAVANVVGRAELYGALAVLGACLLYLRGRSWTGWGRAGLLLGLAGLYAFGLGAKEIAVTLPAVLLLMETFVGGDQPLARRVWAQAGVFTVLAVTLMGYLAARHLALGSLLGEVPAHVFRGMDPGERVLTAITLWPVYLRLMLFPLDLSADYSPAVLLLTRSVDLDVLRGLGVMVAVGAAGAVGWKTRSPVAFGIAWFALTVLPVSNLLFPAGVLMAERILYLPSVGACVVLGGGGAWLLERSRGALRPVTLAILGVAGAALFARTVSRNPSWMSSFAVLSTLAREHPESYVALSSRATGLARVGDFDAAGAAYETALVLAPFDYELLTEAGNFHGGQRDWSRGEDLLRRAITVNPYQPTAYRLLAAQLIRQGRGREAHATALQGQARSGPDRELWALVSESYVTRGDLPAAIRAREAATSVGGDGQADWLRLAELHEAAGNSVKADRARERARTAGGPGGTP